jgi:carboxyl-terminal processing protease
MRAGVEPGWILDEIDTTKVAPLMQAVIQKADERERRMASVRLLLNIIRRFHGTPGSGVHLVLRDARDRRLAMTIVRQPAQGSIVRLMGLPPLPTRLEWRRLRQPWGCVGVIHFNTWMTPVSNAFEDAMNALRDCEGVVLDLRGNPGGVAAMVVGITGHFVDHEVLLGVLHMRGSELRYVANPRRVTRDGVRREPYAGRLALLVDQMSASTTEIFAAALQHYGRARIFGDTTAGQALPSLLARLPNGDGLLYAVADLTDPGGRRLEGQGVIPDERVPLSRSALIKRRDDALQAALRWMEPAGRTP